jgi:eukaryotic-like serine/threonine-protein kinase
MLLEGMQLGRYRLAQLLGTGGMGEVYLGEDTHIRRQVAIKVTRAEATPYPNSASARESARLFQREVRAIAMLDHLYILPLFDYGEQDMEATILTYMVMPYRKEGSLATWLRQRGDTQLLTPQEIAHFVQQASLALSYAHAHQIVHQDVKPSNFLLRDNELSPNLPDLLLADFGIAKFTSASASMSQSSRGTPTYMAPEQWSGQPVAASDQYALAIMTYQLLTGSLPFQGRQEQVMYQHFHAQPQPPSSHNPRTPKDVDSVILRALSKKPEERFPTIAAFATALQQAMIVPDPPKVVPPIASGESPKPSRILPSNDGDMRATIAISRQEATTGTTRSLNLPGGRRMTVPIPSGVPDGQVIRLENQGETTGVGTTGALVLTIAIAPEETRLAAQRGNENETVRSDSQAAKEQLVASKPIKERMLRFAPRRRVAIIIGLVVLIVFVSSGVFYFKYFNFIHRLSLLNAGIADAYGTDPNASGFGRLVMNDPLSDNSLGYFWGEGVGSDGGSCEFINAAYNVAATAQEGYHFCLSNTNISNFTYQVDVTVTQGNSAGVVFRADNSISHLYYFHIGVDQSYELDVVHVGGSITTLTSSSLGSSNSNVTINGFNQSNLIAVVANGSTIDLYVNGQMIDSVTDSTLSQGYVGVAASTSTEATFSNALVWTA